MPAIRRLIGMLLLAMAIAAQPRLVSAQQEGTNAESNCKYCDPCAQPGYVRADYCTACHNDKAGGPSTCTWVGGCGNISPCGSAMTPERVEELLRAAPLGDLEPILLALEEDPIHVVLNHERRSVQVISCSGATVVNAPLPTWAFLAVAARARGPEVQLAAALR